MAVLDSSFDAGLYVPETTNRIEGQRIGPEHEARVGDGTSAYVERRARGAISRCAAARTVRLPAGTPRSSNVPTGRDSVGERRADDAHAHGGERAGGVVGHRARTMPDCAPRGIAIASSSVTARRGRGKTWHCRAWEGTTGDIARANDGEAGIAWRATAIYRPHDLSKATCFCRMPTGANAAIDILPSGLHGTILRARLLVRNAVRTSLPCSPR
jgi:hypothetical protein